jgi:hypothetical protein
MRQDFYIPSEKFSNCQIRKFYEFNVASEFNVTSLTITSEQSASITARYTHQNCVRVVPPEDGQVMPETCRGFEF